MLVVCVPKTKLYWKKTKNDLMNVEKTLEVFASTFIKEKRDQNIDYLWTTDISGNNVDNNTSNIKTINSVYSL